jgi:hypothetical protein
MNQLVQLGGGGIMTRQNVTGLHNSAYAQRLDHVGNLSNHC